MFVFLILHKDCLFNGHGLRISRSLSKQLLIGSLHLFRTGDLCLLVNILDRLRTNAGQRIRLDHDGFKVLAFVECLFSDCVNIFSNCNLSQFLVTAKCFITNGSYLIILAADHNTRRDGISLCGIRDLG